MVSQLGWIDFSSEDRDKVKQALAMMAGKGTLDELGIGQIRDAFADLLFPGLSTIQTRAKYFIFIPRLLRDYQQLPASYRKKLTLQHYLKTQENGLVQQLIECCSADERGIIGRTSVAIGGVKQLPSSIYWGGLRKFHIANTSASLAELAVTLQNHEERLSQDHQDDSVDHFERPFFDLPNSDKDWRNESKIQMQLTADEASFLVSKMTETVGLENSIFAQLFASELVKDGALVDNLAFDDLAKKMIYKSNVSDVCKYNLKLASDFSLAMVGPQTVLNFLLAQANGDEEQVISLSESYDEWANEAHNRAVFNNESVEGWLSVRVDGKPRNIKSHTQLFIREFATAFQASSGHEQIGAKIQQIVSCQSRKNKGKLSKLNNNTPYESWVGIERLDFRWSTARGLLKDLLEGLTNAGT